MKGALVRGILDRCSGLGPASTIPGWTTTCMPIYPSSGIIIPSDTLTVTTSMTDRNAHSGDTPVKNWGGVGITDLPDVSGLDKDAATHNRKGAEPCWRCPISCQASLYAGEGEYKYPEGTRRIEYETQGSFGTLCLNTNTESLNM